MLIKFKKCSDNAKMPTANKEGDIGFDLSCDKDYTLSPCSTTRVSTGLQLASMPEITRTSPPTAVLMKIESRSGLALKGVWAVGGIIDVNYRGMIDVILYNSTTNPVSFKAGDRIAQVVLYRVFAHTNDSAIQFVEVDEVEETNRGQNGFGSSGA